MTVADFCHEHYDTAIFPESVGGVDVVSVFYKLAADSINEVDSRFSSIPREIFDYEITLIRMELFALAFLHNANEDLAPIQSEVTRSYVNEVMWVDMKDYNDTIALSATYGLSGKSPSDRMKITSINQRRMSAFDKWINFGYEANTIARAANRLGTQPSWDNNPLPNLLVATLQKRTGLNESLNNEAIFRLQGVMFGFYSGARDAIKKVHLSH